MQVTAVVHVTYDIEERDLEAAYGTTVKAEVLEQERQWIEGDDGQGDYLMSLLESAKVEVIDVTEETD